MQTIKNMLKKPKENGRDPYLTMLEYRNTQIANNLPSPSQLLMGRRTQTCLPMTKKLLNPQVIDPIDAKASLQKKSKSTSKIEALEAC